jgi:PII-like signaling protein
MTHALSGERTLMRIAVSSADHYRDRPLYRAIVELLRERGFAGATVLPCIMGFGARRVLYSELNEITSLGLPVVVETVDAEERIASVLPELDRMITGGVITLERSRVLVYRAQSETPGGVP